ncbi:MAG: hypothetical protein ACI8PZ_004450 [Myxococcota bacterium]|jgi:hypothetical protein
MLVLLLLAPLTAQAVELTISGSCPGLVTLTSSGVTPGGSMALVSSTADGELEIPVGPCTGTVLALDPAGAKLRSSPVDDDADGVVSVTPSVPGAACGQRVVAVDLTTCEVSGVAFVPDLVPVDAVMMAASGAGRSGLWAIDPVAGTAVWVADPGRPITGLTFDEAGTLYAIQGGGYSAVANPTYGQIDVVDPSTGTLEAIAETGQYETSLAWGGGLLYAVDENTEVATIDPGSGLIEVLPARADGEGFGYALAHDGETLWRVSDTGLYTIDALGVDTLIAPVSGAPGGNRGGATFHEGELWIAIDAGPAGTLLATVDTVTGVATPTGILIPDTSIDALASRTP